MYTIIAAVDFSDSSLNAARYAVDFAHSLNARVMLFHVSKLPLYAPSLPLTGSQPLATFNDATDQLFIQGEYLLKRGNYKVQVDTIVKSGDFIIELENYAHIVKPYAIIMGGVGTTAAEKILFGSNALLAIKKLTCPIVIVPAGISFKNINKIAIACDMTAIYESVHTDIIKKLVKDLHALLYIVYVNTEKDLRISHEKADSSEILKEELAELAPEFHFLHHENLQQGLADFSKQHNVDLLIIIPKKHKGLENLVFKSHSKQTILHAHLPIMSIRE